MNKLISFTTITATCFMLMTVTAQAKSDDELHGKVEETIKLIKEADPSVEKFFKEAYAYVVFPSVKKVGFGIGGAGGSGEFYEKETIIGRARLSQATIGFQFGAQVYAEVIFFENEAAAVAFKKGKFKLSAQATAVAATSGVAAKTKYAHGMAIFTMAHGGLMYEATVGGQKFKYKPNKKSE